MGQTPIDVAVTEIANVVTIAIMPCNVFLFMIMPSSYSIIETVLNKEMNGLSTAHSYPMSFRKSVESMLSVFAIEKSSFPMADKFNYWNSCKRVAPPS